MHLPTPPPRQEQRRLSPSEVHAEKLIREAEQAKARIYGSPGKNQPQLNYELPRTDDRVDDYFLVVAVHIDEGTKLKIMMGEYVDFAKLIPKDKMMLEEDHQMEMVNKWGVPHWVPVADRECAEINSVTKWDQAFRDYSNIYA